MELWAPQLAMIRNMILFFVVTFVLTTTLDIWTTWVAVNQLGYTETNPLTDTSSIQGMAIPEIITLFIGVAMIAVGAHFSKTLRPPPDERFASYFKRFLSVEKFFNLLVLFPILVAVVRIVPVLSNASLIFFDWGLFGEDTPWIDLIVMLIFFMIFIRPTIYMVFRVCRASTP